MREIKFRVILGGLWHYWGFIEHHGKICFAGIPSTNMEPCSIEDIREKSQQYTGLKDKNGTEIYEGDIAKDYCCRYIIKFNEGSFVLVDIDPIPNEEHHYPVNSIDDDVEIIGNIYENPELLNH